MTGIELIAAERARQIEKEGFTAEHDADGFHCQEELAWAAMYYAMPHSLSAYAGMGQSITIHPMFFFEETGWDSQWGKRDGKDRFRQLAVAGALIAAEIDRLQREADNA